MEKENQACFFCGGPAKVGTEKGASGGVETVIRVECEACEMNGGKRLVYWIEASTNLQALRDLSRAEKEHLVRTTRDMSNAAIQAARHRTSV